MTTPPKSEFALIDWIKQNAGFDNPDVLTGIGDDMAVMQVGSEKILITTDILLEGAHFDLKHATLTQLGYKAMACSLSDCAAMAAKPFIAVVAVALPRDMTMAQAQKLNQGLQQAAQKYHCPIVGGDTTSWDHSLAVNITMLAKDEGIQPVLRSGAQPGDTICVTGQLGGSIHQRHLQFTPRVNEARQLAQLINLHAMIDLSDGLAGDLPHICRQSHAAALIHADKLPISPDAQKAPNPLTAALTDGEDFELLFTLSPTDAQTLTQQWPKISDTPITPIGHILTPQQHQTLQQTIDNPQNALIYLQKPDETIQPITLKAWEHFRD